MQNRIFRVVLRTGAETALVSFLAAVYIPARRAGNMDPVAALKHD
jgi:ABC-type lipoprotein release transport system permease subunit